MAVTAGTVALNIVTTGFFVDTLTNSHGKVPSSKKHTQLKTRLQKPNSICDQNGQD